MELGFVYVFFEKGFAKFIFINYSFEYIYLLLLLINVNVINWDFIVFRVIIYLIGEWSSFIVY